MDGHERAHRGGPPGEGAHALSRNEIEVYVQPTIEVRAADQRTTPKRR
jgi:hypothetical protein